MPKGNPTGYSTPRKKSSNSNSNSGGKMNAVYRAERIAGKKVKTPRTRR